MGKKVWGAKMHGSHPPRSRGPNANACTSKCVWTDLVIDLNIFCNPDTYPGIGGAELANFVKGLWTAVQDFSIELLNEGEIEPGVVAHHWLVRGTDAARADGSKPTGRSLTIQGASIIQVEGEKIRSDQAYFDRKALDKQLEPSS